jgi:hypothetical protein
MHLTPSMVMPGNTYKLAVRIPILVQGFEVPLIWICTGEIAPSEMRALYTVFALDPEAANGRLRVYALRASRSFTVTVPDPQAPGRMITKLCTAPVWEPSDWMDYNEELFGLREVPPPPLPVGVTPAAPMLAQDISETIKEVPIQTAPNGDATEPPAEIPTPEPRVEPRVDPFKNIAARGKKESPPF